MYHDDKKIIKQYIDRRERNISEIICSSFLSRIQYELKLKYNIKRNTYNKLITIKVFIILCKLRNFFRFLCQLL